MAVNISYKCPNCGAELFWSADKTAGHVNTATDSLL